MADIRITQAGLGGSESREGVGLHDPETPPPGLFQRPQGFVSRSLVPGHHHAAARLSSQDGCPSRYGCGGLQELGCRFQLLVAAVTAGVPEIPAESLMQAGPLSNIGNMGERPAQQTYCRREVPRPPGGVRRRNLEGAGDGVRSDLVEEVEGPAVVMPGFREGIDRIGLTGRHQAGFEGAIRIAGGVPVGGDPGGQDRPAGTTLFFASGGDRGIQSPHLEGQSPV